MHWGHGGAGPRADLPAMDFVTSDYGVQQAPEVFVSPSLPTEPPTPNSSESRHVLHQPPGQAIFTSVFRIAACRRIPWRACQNRFLAPHPEILIRRFWHGAENLQF